MPLFARSVTKWLPIGVAVALALTISYTFVQQSYRNGANDPQIQMARDAADGIGLGNPAQKFVPDGTVDPSRALGPFLMVLDKDGGVVKSSMQLGSSVPIPPKGVLQAASSSGENRVTWQPRSDTRIAAVVVPINAGRDGWVVAGRSLEVVEQREGWLTQMWGLGTLGTLVATFLTVMFAARVEERIAARD